MKRSQFEQLPRIQQIYCVFEQTPFIVGLSELGSLTGSFNKFKKSDVSIEDCALVVAETNGFGVVVDLILPDEIPAAKLLAAKKGYHVVPMDEYYAEVVEKEAPNVPDGGQSEHACGHDCTCNTSEMPEGFMELLSHLGITPQVAASTKPETKMEELSSRIEKLKEIKTLLSSIKDILEGQQRKAPVQQESPRVQAERSVIENAIKGIKDAGINQNMDIEPIHVSDPRFKEILSNGAPQNAQEKEIVDAMNEFLRSKGIEGAHVCIGRK